MKKGNVYRIYPINDEQKIMLEKHFGSTRFVYNKLLEFKKIFYDKFRINISLTELEKYLPMFKEIYPWLKEVNSQSLQQVRRNLQNAYTRFFKGQAGFPQLKKKKDNKFSFQVTQRYKINLTKSTVFIPGIGWMNIKIHRDLLPPEIMHNFIEKKIVDGETIIEKDLNKDFFRTATVSRTATGKYHLSILTEDGEPVPEKVEYSEDTTVGVDLGIKDFAILSNGEIIENPKYLKNSEKRLKVLQRRVSRKKKGSQNRRKAIRQLAKQHEKIANQRHDFQHKQSAKLIGDNQAVAIETLNVKGMIKNHKLAKAIQDASWGSFGRMLEYKAERAGKTILRIGMFEPSTKKCSVCGFRNPDITLKVREWECPKCKTFHDRDINAAINIKMFALAS